MMKARFKSKHRFYSNNTIVLIIYVFIWIYIKHRNISTTTALNFHRVMVVLLKPSFYMPSEK